MRLIALEEHVATPEMVEAWRRLPEPWREVGDFKRSAEGPIAEALREIGPARIAAMDDAGVDVQVLSLTTPGVQSLAPAEAARLQGQVNDLLAARVRDHPDRFQAFATLAAPDPAAAAKELERTVTGLGFQGAMLFGRTRDRNMDHPDFWPIYEAAAALKAPLYLHPQSPQVPVREAYYDGFNEHVSNLFAIAGIGWHYETGIQLIRLILSGVLDRCPDLQIIVGHWGEVVLFYLERLDTLAAAAKLPRKFEEYFRSQIHVTPSGIWSQRYLRWAIEVMGVDRILFSQDYPYKQAPGGASRRFLEEADLSEEHKVKIASGNWEKLVSGIKR